VLQEIWAGFVAELIGHEREFAVRGNLRLVS
jgi:hypothetical protein